MIRVLPGRVGAMLLLVVGLLAANAPSAFAGTTYGPNGPSNVNTNQQTISKAADLTTGIIQDRINNATTDAGFGTFSASAPTFAIGNGGGKAAGDEPAKIGDRSSFMLEGTTTQFREYFQAYGINGSFRINF